MDKTSLECFTRRVIVAERNALDRLQDVVTEPPVSEYPPAELYFGAMLLGVDRTLNNRFAFELALTKPLTVGQRHEHGMIQRSRTTS